jgi:hypothetical protein
MPRALPPSSDHAPRSLALVARKNDVDDALIEQIRAHKLHADTAEALQRRINSLLDLKAARAKTLAAAVRRTEDDLATAVIGEQFAALLDSVKRVTTSYEVGATPAPADVKLIMAHSVEARAKFMAWQLALKTKKKEASRFKDRIDEVREALSKLLLRGTEKQEDPQTTIPGIDTEPPEPQGWANETTKRVIIETFAHEVKRADHEAKRAAGAGDDVAERVARARAAERQALIDELKQVSALKPFLDGFVSIGHSAVDALLKVIPTMTEKLPGIFKSVEAAIKGMAKGAKFDSAVPEWARSLVDLFVKVKDVLVPEIKKLFWTMWPLVKPYVIDGLKFLFVTSFAPAVLKVALSAVTATFTSAVGGMLKDAVIGAFKAPKAAVTEGVEGVASSLGRSSTSAFSKVEGFFSKGIGKALGAAALVAVVADASIEVGAALKEFPDKLQDEGFDPATSKIAAGATGMVNALTLGLVPKSLQDDIAKSIAEVVKVLDDKVRDTFGPQFAESNKKYFASAFQVFGSVGDILVSLWKGDSKGFNEAADALFDGLMGLISSSIERLIVGIPFIFLKVQKFIMDSWSFMLSKAGDVSLALKDVPVVGPLFEYFGLGLKALSEIPKLIGELLDEAAEVVKGFKFSYFTEGWEKVSSVVRRVFTSISDFAKEAWEDTVRPFRQVGEALSSAFKPVMTGIDEVASSFSWIGDAFDSAVESISGGIEWVVDTLTSTAKTVFNVLSYPFDLWMDRVFGVVEAVYGNYKELAGFLREVGSKIFEVLMSPHTKGTAKVKAMWGVVTEGFSAIPDLLKSMGKRLFNAITSPYKKAYDAVTGLFSSDTFGKVFDEVVTVVSTSLEKLADSAPFKAVIDVAKKVFDIHSPSKEFTKVGDMVASGFTSAVTDIPEVAGKSFDATAAAARKMGKDVSSSMKDAVDVRGPDLASVVQSALRQSEDVANVIVQQSESLVASIDAATNSMARIVDAVSAGRISDVPLAAAGKSIKQFQKAISVIQRMDDALSRTPDVDISAKMAAVASRLGLGSSGVYTVKSKEVVINVNMNVTMDAGEVEKAIVHRSNSIIRDRINYALGSGDGKNNRVQQSIPETPEPLTKFAAGVN